MGTLQSRIDELEIRISHQDRTIAELNDVITSQWKKLEAMDRQLRRLDEELQAFDGGDVPVTKPPHY